RLMKELGLVSCQQPTHFLDLFARKPVGWAMSFSPDSKLTIKALEMAWETRGKPAGVMFPSDQGSHYTSRQ
ncbi:DDE-type integrase/transposase/recombinase, partial [Enterobacter hormaechei]